MPVGRNQSGREKRAEMSAEEKILEVIKSEEKHRRYNQAVQNSTRRKVLGFLADGEKSFSELLISTQMV